LFGRQVGAEQAPDLVQESFLRYARRAMASSQIESPVGYLMRIALNLARNPQEIAKRVRAARHQSFDENAYPGADPHPRIEARDMLERLDKAITRLKPKTRTVFLLHRVEGLSYAQIAEQTGLSVKGVEKQMSKALADLDRLVHRS
jgi:RNA polymerase sigma-70 factor (ECF subfamily)